MRYIIGGIITAAALMLVRLWASSRIPRNRDFTDLDWEQYRQRKEKQNGR